MLKSSQKNVDKTSKAKEEKSSSNTIKDDTKKNSTTKLSTPRNFVKKSSATDVYGQKKFQASRAPQKVGSTSGSKASPMSSLLKSTPSTASLKSHPEKPDAEKKTVTKSTEKGKKLPVSNVTVSTPPTRRKLELTRENSQINSSRKAPKTTSLQKSKMAEKEAGKSQEVKSHQRQKTRTLTDEEVKVLTPESVDNNAEMKKLLKLNAKPKAFFVDLEGAKTQKQKQISPAASEISYEDDFESYESDFESYHSDRTGSDENRSLSDENRIFSDDETKTSSRDDTRVATEKEIVERRDGKDEERMLDSGNFDLERRSATRPSMADIVEATEGLDTDDKNGRVSLPDEGFQDMSSSSVRSHVEVLERSLFIDFEKSKSNKKKRIISQKLQQRAKDILKMIKLHEMTYSLFEMQPIPYDLYMATFGRQNYTQTSSQTFDDGITEEVQTDGIAVETKWTQHPVKFSKFLHHFNDTETKRPSDEDFLHKFTFIFQSTSTYNTSSTQVDENKINTSYTNNPLKIYLEQKDGVGTDKMIPSISFEEKLNKIDYNCERLKKFLKKTERRISNILSLNANTTTTDFKKSFFSFSKGYSTLYNNTNTNIKYLQNKPVNGIVVSKQNKGFLITIHSQTHTKQTLACLWDMTVATRQPLKTLTAIDNMVYSLFSGKSDGFFVATLRDSSIHLWDLSEPPMIVHNAPNKPSEKVELNSDGLSQSEIDREWNLRNSQIVDEETFPLLQACAYTSSAVSLESGDTLDSIVGMDFVDDKFYRQDGGRKIVGQICTLQKNGLLTTWLIVQHKSNKKPDIGKAFWSKMTLEKNYTINLTNYVEPVDSYTIVEFNLIAAKKRLSVKRDSRNSRLKSAIESRPSTARSKRRDLPDSWECGVLCCDLKVVKSENEDCFLIAKNCGEVLRCWRIAGSVKVQRFCVSNDKSTITLLETSAGLPYFLAATDTGIIHLCSLLENRVLLSLDCQNITPESQEKYGGDLKGRYIGTIPVKPVDFVKAAESVNDKIKSLSWSLTNPCRVISRTAKGIATWDLTRSDIYATKTMRPCKATTFTSDGHVILLSEGELQIHQQLDEDIRLNIDIFKKYVALL